MNRDTLVGLLRRVPGSAQEGDIFLFADAHEVAFYLGEPGQATVVRAVTRCELREQHVELTARDPDSVWFVEYNSLHAVSARDLKDRAGRRAGF